ncbi:recombinase family protein, partial [Actinomadura adrarensis]
GMLAEVAAFESDRASEQWKETHQHRRGAGLPVQGTKRWGYVRLGRVAVTGEKSLYRNDPHDPDGERYEPDPELAPVYRSLYERYLSGTGITKLATWMNQQGYKTVRGSAWSYQTLLKMLDSGFAAGLLRQHNPECRCKQRGRCQDVTYIPGAQQAIIDEDTWERYRKRRALLRTLPPRSHSPSYPLSGLLRHGQPCGYALTAIGAKG